MAGSPSKTSAAGTTLGYLAQIEWALGRAVELVRDARTETAVSIELLDDFAVHGDDHLSALEWWQTKHTVDSQRTLTDFEVEFWKTLHNWVNAHPSEDAALFLVTNARVTEGSGLEALTKTSHNPDRAAERLVAALDKSKSEDLEKYSAAWTALPHSRRVAFLAKVTLVAEAPSGAEVNEVLHRGLSIACRPQHREAVSEILRGWWYDRVRTHLQNFWAGDYQPIRVNEVSDRIYAIQDRLRSDDLPFIDVEIGAAGELQNSDDAVFVQQLKLISLHSQRIANCILEHNRAYQQRSFWQRRDLLRVGELERYEQILKSEWRRYFLPLSGDEAELKDDQSVCAKSRENFDSLDKSALPAIRPHVSERFIANGSLHILADRLEIGWHPDYIERLRKVLEIPDVEGEGVA